MRRFERVDVPRARDAVLPKRATARSAGYDFVAPYDIIVHAGGSNVATLRTGIKARMEPDEFLMICIRSSLGIFMKYLLAEDDRANAERNGGVGSTGE